MKKIILFLVAVFSASPVMAQDLRAALIASCEQRHAQQKDEEYESECYQYGNKMECTSTPRKRGYDPYAVHIAGKCVQEAEETLNQYKNQVIREQGRY